MSTDGPIGDGTTLISFITSASQDTTLNPSSLTFFTTESISDISASINGTHSGTHGLSNYVDVSELRNAQLIVGLSTGFGVLCAIVIGLVITGILFHKRNNKGKQNIKTFVADSTAGYTDHFFLSARKKPSRPILRSEDYSQSSVDTRDRDMFPPLSGVFP